MCRFRSTAVLGLVTFFTAVVAATPASAVPDPVYGEWTMPGASGTLTVPATGFPAGTVTTDASSTRIGHGGSTFLAPNTPFGQVFGGSQNKQYLYARPAGPTTPSTTTITFASPTPVGGWGFTLGDVDADKVELSGTSADGSPLTGAQLGWQGAFNYCGGIVPKPRSCATASGTDLPAWDPASRTLTGNGPDTGGASGWFRPTAGITSLTLKFTPLSGSPIYQVWIASLTRSISGTLTEDCNATKAAATVRLLDSSGKPVLGTDGKPAVTNADSKGAYSFPAVAPGKYQVRAGPADGLEVDGANPVPADLTGGNASGADFTLTCATKPPGTSQPGTSQPGGTMPVPGTTVSPPGSGGTVERPLASTGVSAASAIWGGAALLALGGCLLYAARRARRSRQ